MKRKEKIIPIEEPEYVPQNKISIITASKVKIVKHLDKVTGCNVSEAIKELKDSMNITYSHELDLFNEGYVVILQVPSKMNLPGFVED